MQIHVGPVLLLQSLQVHRSFCLLDLEGPILLPLQLLHSFCPLFQSSLRIAQVSRDEASSVLGSPKLVLSLFSVAAVEICARGTAREESLSAAVTCKDKDQSGVLTRKHFRQKRGKLVKGRSVRTIDTGNHRRCQAL